MQESIVFLLRVQCRRKESSRSLSHLVMSFLFYKKLSNIFFWGRRNGFDFDDESMFFSTMSHSHRKREPLLSRSLKTPFPGFRSCKIAYCLGLCVGWMRFMSHWLFRTRRHFNLHLRRCKSICMSNLNEIFQSTAEIKLLPVSENGRPPLEFYFRFRFWRDGMRIHWHVISFLHLPVKFRSYGRSAAELWRHIHCSRWRPAAILDLILVTLDHPRSAIVGLSLVLKFGLDPCYLEILRFSYLAVLGWNCLFITPIFWRGEGHTSPKYGQPSF